jgi:transcriptional regulator with XRE-family HTH domain
VDLSQQHALNYLLDCGYNLTKQQVIEVNCMANTEVCLQEIGKRITARRKQLGLTQEALAEKADLTTQFVSYAESGKRAMRPENLLKLSAALGVSADYLLTGQIVDKDLLLLSNKLSTLTPEQLRLIEKLLDDCIDYFDE